MGWNHTSGQGMGIEQCSVSLSALELLNATSIRQRKRVPCLSFYTALHNLFWNWKTERKRGGGSHIRTQGSVGKAPVRSSARTRHFLPAWLPFFKRMHSSIWQDRPQTGSFFDKGPDSSASSRHLLSIKVFLFSFSPYRLFLCAVALRSCFVLVAHLNEMHLSPSYRMESKWNGIDWLSVS
ncbi:uncharacterized protein DMAD_00843 [Drosophila madeirensis]|uniref:Uncharacterized protein n=1 Tax=Drosophila madeirensis TaxID=30013 RepID=A0AAU9G083_DROMD